MEYLLRYLQGRNWNGAHRDAGIRIHVITSVFEPALCGSKPGRLSGGWGEPDNDVEVSCPRCAKKLKKIRAGTPLHKCSGCSTLIAEGEWCEGCHKKGLLNVAEALKSLCPVEPEPLLQEPPDSSFLRMLWNAAQESE